MKVDGPPLVLNIRTAYDLLVGAVDRAGPVHPLLQQWAPFFIEQLAERNDARGIEPLPRSYLDGALARLEALSKAESYISSLRDGPTIAVASLSDLDGPPNMLAPWPGVCPRQGPGLGLHQGRQQLLLRPRKRPPHARLRQMHGALGVWHRLLLHL